MTDSSTSNTGRDDLRRARFDFLHAPNLALIIGPYSPDLADPIRRRDHRVQHAAGTWMTASLLLASSPYQGHRLDRPPS